jgi:PAS domain S-box-containing protein
MGETASDKDRLDRELLRSNAELRARCRELEAEVLKRTTAEQAARAAQEQLRSLAESSRDFILLVALDGTIQFLNRTLPGESVDQFLGRRLDVVVGPREGAKVAECLERVKRSGRADRYEVDYPLIDGRIGHFEGSVAPVQEHGEVAAFAITVRDLTHRVRMENALRSLVEETWHKRGKEFFRSLVQALAAALDCRHAMLAVLDDDLRRLSTLAMLRGDEFAEDFEFELQGTPAADVVRQELCCHGDGVCETFPRDPLLAALGARRYLGMRLVSPDGVALGVLAAMDERPLEITPEAQSIIRIFARHAEAELVRSAAEEALRNSEESLRASERRLRTLVEYAPEAIVILDVDTGKFVDCNPVAVELFGRSREEILGVDRLQLSPERQPDGRLSRELSSQWIEAALAGGTPSYEWTYRHARGYDVPCEVRLVQLPSAGRRLIRGSITDITRRKLAEKEREQLIHQLEEKNAELERFTYTVSHDLKSPLITIKGFAGMLREDIAAGRHDSIQEDLGEIAAAADRMRGMLDELLHLSRIGRIANPSERVSMADLVREAIDNLSHRITERKVEVRVSANLPPAYGDRVRLLEVVQNLLDNAIKFSDADHPLVEVGARRENGQTVFYVRDSGIGIDPEFHERVFRLFEQLNPEQEGTGVGLAIVKRIIEIHGGRIWVESKGQGQGSAFCFTLPESHERFSEDESAGT